MNKKKYISPETLSISVTTTHFIAASQVDSPGVMSVSNDDLGNGTVLSRHGSSPWGDDEE